MLNTMVKVLGHITMSEKPMTLCVVKIIGGNLAVPDRDRMRCFQKIPSESLIA